MGHYIWGELGLSHIPLGLWGDAGRPLDIYVDVSVLVSYSFLTCRL